MNFFAGLAESFFLPLCLTIDAYLYKFFSYLYGIFLYIANMRILTNDLYESISSRIYIVVGIVALFLLAYTFLQNIIDPENKKSDNGVGLVKRILIAFISVILVPVAFDFLYGLQNAILSGNVISSIFLGGGETLEQFKVISPVKYVSPEGEEYYLCEVGCMGNMAQECDMVDASTVSFEDENFDPTDYDWETGCNGGPFLTTNKSEFDLEMARQRAIGNQMTYSILEGFLSPSPGVDLNSVKGEANSFFNSGTAWGGGLGCLIGGIAGAVGAIAGAAVAPVTFGAGLALTGTALSAAGSACVTGLVIGGLAGGLGGMATVAVLSPDNYTWAIVKQHIYADGTFELIIPFTSAIQDGDLQYLPIVSTLAIGFVIYMLLNFIIDLGIRVFKLAFYQIIAPIPIFMSILPNNEKLLSNWVKIILTTYFEVFVRVASMAGLAYFVYLINMVI